MLIFCLPHQFIPSVCHQLKDAQILGPEAIAVSLVKGVDVKGDRILIFPDVIRKELGVSCSALSGANIADEGELAPLVKLGAFGTSQLSTLLQQWRWASFRKRRSATEIAKRDFCGRNVGLATESYLPMRSR